MRVTVRSSIWAMLLRTLRQTSKRPGLQFGFGAFVFLMYLSVTLGGGWWSAEALGRTMFFRITFWNIFALFLATGGYFASAITEEKEEETLGLLQMAGIDGVALLLGKSTTRLLLALWLMLLQFPFVLLCVSLGGLTYRQVIAVYLALGATAVGWANLALLCSVLCRKSQTAGRLVATWLLGEWWAMYVGQMLLTEIAVHSNGRHAILDHFVAGLTWWNQTRATTRMWEILQSDYAGSLVGPHFWVSLASGGISFLLAWKLLPACSQVDRGERASPRPARRRGWNPSRWGMGRAWGNAIAWKDLFFHNGGYARPAGIGILLVAWCGVCMVVEVSSGSKYRSLLERSENVIGVMIVTLTSVLSLHAMYCATNLFSEELQQKTLSSLMMLPGGAASILRQKWQGVLPALTFEGVMLCLAIGLWWLVKSFEPVDMPRVIVGSVLSLGVMTLFVSLLSAYSIWLPRRYQLAAAFFTAFNPLSATLLSVGGAIVAARLPEAILVGSLIFAACLALAWTVQASVLNSLRELAARE